MNVIQSGAIDLVVTIGKWCLILLGPFEKAYDMSQNTMFRDTGESCYPLASILH